MRNVPDTLDRSVVAEIDARLERVAADERVAVSWAVESGSRAWGFPSPDSDYDCRFLYLRSANDYLGLWPLRDVIETPLDKVFDVNGWDVAKALRLLLKGNATVVEWLTSPIVYRGDVGFRDGLLDLASEVIDPARVGRHYLHVGRNQWDLESETVPLKKVFYALRPAAALRWLRTHPGSAVAPMDLATLLREGEVPEAVMRETDELLAVKAVTRELGEGRFPEPLASFVLSEFAAAHEAYENASATIEAWKTARVDEFFRTLIL
ncbi:DNA polymerase beta superfamily protein [Paeniglutamicibacter sp. NPDC012692]|uniref:nucleotidyltransferase domain-containing protein n=1 Tax=Paeniglutamicibacter sp. NPDC012692 TaxID=3364388 RepID=UPI0036A54911